MSKKDSLIKFALIWGIGLLVGGVFWVVRTQAREYREPIRNVIEHLLGKEIPVKSVDLIGTERKVVEVTLQSDTTNQLLSAKDVTYLHALERELVFLQSTGSLPVDAVRIVTVNNGGSDTIYWKEMYLSEWGRSYESREMLSAETQTVIKDTMQHLIQPMPVAVTQFGIEQDDYGPVITLELVTPDAQVANTFVSEMIMGADDLFNGLTRHKPLAEIGVLKILLLDSEGTILLDYTRDYQLDKETWWEHDDLDGEWYPQPPPTFLEELFGR
ncbi:MAG: hypothetical protein H6668_14615 [Ardenticatenaceae bacterium]|nr:hypothetical protein [Ardenticatenaceae bacterium]